MTLEIIGEQLARLRVIQRARRRPTLGLLPGDADLYIEQLPSESGDEQLEQGSTEPLILDVFEPKNRRHVTSFFHPALDY
jgi:hypothetical protein